MKNSFGYTKKIPISGLQKSEYLSFACQISKQAGLQTLPYFRSNIIIENKLSDGGFDPVTQADKQAETVIRNAIEHQYPEHGILGEEYGHKLGNGLTWVIDPIDGTKAFMSGMLHWGVLLGLFDGETPILGVMYQPYTDELFFGNGNEAWLSRSGKEVVLQTQDVSLVHDAVLGTTGPNWFKGARLEQFARLRDSAKMCRYGGDCYLFAMVAMGYVHLATDCGLNAYDIQALVPIIRGAGGVITTYEGTDPSLGGAILASANVSLHEHALTILNG